MADYRELLRRAVDVLPENNGAARRQVYEKARNALVAQLRAIEPPLPAREITQHRLQLEDCIREVEQAATEDLLAGARAEEDAALKAKANPAPVVKPEPAPLPEPELEPEVVQAPEPEPEPEEEPELEEELEAEPEAEQEPESAPEPTSSEEDEPEADTESETDETAEPESQEEAAPEATADGQATTKFETKPEAQDEDAPEVEEDPTPEEADDKADAPADSYASDDEDHADAPDEADAKSEDTVEAEEPEAEPETSPPTPDVADADDQQSQSNTKASEDAIQQLIQEAESDTASVKPVEASVTVSPIDFDILKRPSAPVPDLKIDLTGAKSHMQPLAAAPQVVAMSVEREVDLESTALDADADSDAQGAVDRAIETLDREARVVNSAPVEPEPQKPVDIRRAKPATPKFEREDVASSEGEGGGGVTIFLIVLAFLIVGASAAGFWAWREGYVDLDAMFGQTASVAQTEEKAPVIEATGPGNTAAAPDAVAPVTQPLAKSDERLPGASSATTAIAEAAPDTVDTKTDDRLGAADNSFAQTTPGAATADSGAAPAADTPVAAASGAQSLLLEASNEGTTGAVPFSGNVEWTRGVDELGQPTLIAKANIPARNLEVDVLIRRNADQTLPASHLIEVDFSISDSFIGGAIASLPGILLKNEELVRGVPLVGASARVVGNSFLFALSAAPQDLNNNMQLLTTRKWIDLALIYATSTRAIITLEKDTAAQKLFDEVMAVWAAADKDAAAATTPAPAAN